jgi:hypothetical protein
MQKFGQKSDRNDGIRFGHKAKKGDGIQFGHKSSTPSTGANYMGTPHDSVKKSPLEKN